MAVCFCKIIYVSYIQRVSSYLFKHDKIRLCDRINNRIYMCGGNSGFKSLSKRVMYDIKSNKFLNLPNLNYERHCNKCELLNTRNNINKWQVNVEILLKLLIQEII